MPDKNSETTFVHITALTASPNKATISSNCASVTINGGAIITWDGHVLARSGGEPIDALVTPAERLGEAMGKPRLMVAEKILRFAAPTLALTLAVLSVVAWAKRRWRARREAPADIAIEEVYDGQ